MPTSEIPNDSYTYTYGWDQGTIEWCEDFKDKLPSIKLSKKLQAMVTKNIEKVLNKSNGG